MSEDNLEGFQREVMEILEQEYASWWSELKADQKGIVTRAAKDLAKYTLLYMKEVERRPTHAATMKHIRGTLESEGALVQLRAAQQVKTAIYRVAMKALDLALGVLTQY